MPQWTNRFGLPEPVVRALTTNEYERHGDFSVTELINPPRVTQLRRRYDDKVIEDVIDRFYSLLGNAMHYVMEKAKMLGAIVEQRFVFPFDVDGVTYQVSMASDYVWPYKENTYQMLDFKCTSIYAVKRGAKPDWVKQMNIYRYGFVNHQGYSLDSMQIIPFLRDWSYTECHVKKTHDYPVCQTPPIDIYIWKDDVTEEYLTDRIRLHVAARTQTDEELPECTMEERWATPDLWAVIGENGKALQGHAKFRSEQDAIDAKAQKVAKAYEKIDYAKQEGTKDKYRKIAMALEKALVIEFRPGKSTRCERYCEVKAFCSQFRSMYPDIAPF